MPKNDPQNSMPQIISRHGAHATRGLDDVPRSTLYEGRFGRIFRTLPPFRPKVPNDDFVLLTSTMLELQNDEAPGEDSRDNVKISSGFTYLGQFIDHDLTFDPNSKLQRENDPNALRNFRTPRFDLDNIYGNGPDDNPFLYDARPENRGKLLIGKNDFGEDDQPRNAQETALVGDPRNDENLIISQLQLVFLKFHNKVMDDLAASGADSEAIFEEARRVVRWHYQWIVLHEFLRRIVGGDVISDVLQPDSYKVHTAGGLKTANLWKGNLKFYDWKNQPYIPVEFSVAAYRFGHSMVRSNYAINIFTDPNDGNEELQIFSNDPNKDLRGFRKRPKEREIEWHYFFEFKKNDEDLQHSRKIDTKLAFGLGSLPFIPKPLNALARRNLKRGIALALPSGQAVAQAMGLPDDLILEPNFNNAKRTDDTGDNYVNLTADEINTLRTNYSAETPLWYYILHEAETLCDGLKLGPVGGRIVAEVFIGILLGDNFSFLNAAPAWKPTKGEFGCRKAGEYTVIDLLKYVGAKE